MGFLNRLFGEKPQDVRAKLEETYVQSYLQMGWSPSEARQAVRAMLERAEERSRRQGTDQYPVSFGDTIVRNRETDPQAASVVARLHDEGVTDDDIRWWWNMHDLERCMLAENDDVSQFALFKHVRDSGDSEETAKRKIIASFPIFGDPESGANEDRPLPFELKNRINRFLEKIANQQHLRGNASKFTSMNAYIRDRIRAGVL